MASQSQVVTFFCGKGYDVRTSLYLNPAHVQGAKEALYKDIDSFVLNALLSYANCVGSIRFDCYSWAFVESYYAIFYMAKALLGINGIALIYAGKTPYHIKIVNGASFKKGRGNSHDFVFELYKSEFANNQYICGMIENDSVVDWFSRKRNEINYRLNPMTDPLPPDPLFKYKGDLREWMMEYIVSKDDVYVYDIGHSYVAYTLRLILEVIREYEENNLKNELITKNVFSYLSGLFCDKRGPISQILNEIEKIMA